MDNTIKQIKEIAGDHITEVEHFVDENGNPQKIVKLDNEGIENFNKFMNDPSLHYLNEFINITKKHRENVSDKFYNLVLTLENTIQTYNAPWYVPYYQGVRNAILVLIFINSNPTLISEDDYKKAIDAAGNIIEELITGFKPEEDGAYNTFPVKFSVKAIFEKVQAALSKEAVNLYDKYEENLQKIEERKSKIKYDTIRMFLVLDVCQKHYKKYEKLYNILMIKAYPHKYSVKKPSKNIDSDELLTAAGKIVIDNGYKVEDLIEDHKDKIGDEIINSLKIETKELEKVHEEVIANRLIEEIPEIKNLLEQVKAANGDLEKLKNHELFSVLSEAMDEIDNPETDAKAEQSAEDLFNKINEKLPDEYKGRRKTPEELAKEKGE